LKEAPVLFLTFKYPYIKDKILAQQGGGLLKKNTFVYLRQSEKGMPKNRRGVKLEVNEAHPPEDIIWGNIHVTS